MGVIANGYLIREALHRQADRSIRHVYPYLSLTVYPTSPHDFKVEMPKVDMPDAPKAPDMPDAPKIEMPKFEAPKMPDMSKFDAPKVPDMPKVSSLDPSFRISPVSLGLLPGLLTSKHQLKYGQTNNSTTL